MHSNIITIFRKTEPHYNVRAMQLVMGIKPDNSWKNCSELCVKQQSILNTHITHTHGEVIVYPCSVAVVVVVSVQRSPPLKPLDQTSCRASLGRGGGGGGKIGGHAHI